MRLPTWKTALCVVLIANLFWACSNEKEQSEETDSVASMDQQTFGEHDLTPYSGVEAGLRPVLKVSEQADGTFEFQNPLVRLRAQSVGGNVSFTTDNEVIDHELSVSFSQVSREDGAAKPLRFDAGEAEGNVLRRKASVAQEYFVNRPRGVEHGLVLGEAPDGSGRVLIDVEVGGGYEAFSKSDFDMVLEKQGAPAISYRELAVFDAKGRELSARMWPLGESRNIRISFDDTDAVYPVVVDPVLAAVADRVWPPATESVPCSRVSPQTYCSFGQAVALFDDVLVVGRPFDGNGSIEIYLRDLGGTGRWSFHRRRDGPTGMSRYGHSVAIGKDGTDFVIAVGAPKSSGDRGEVELLVMDEVALRNPAATASFAPTTARVFFGADVLADNQFGTSVAVNGNFVAIGGPSAASNGRVFLVQKAGTTFNGHSWYEISSGTNNQLGTSVAMDDNLVVAGAPNVGEILVIDRTTPTGAMNRFESVIDDDGTGVDAPRTSVRVGESVDVQNNKIVAGAPEISDVIEWTYTPNAGAIGALSDATRTNVAAVGDYGGYRVATNGSTVWATIPELGGTDEGQLVEVGGGQLSLPTSDRTSTNQTAIGTGAHLGIALARDLNSPTGNILAAGAPGFAYDREMAFSESNYANGAVAVVEGTNLVRIVKRQADEDLTDFSESFDIAGNIMVVQSRGSSANDPTKSGQIFIYERRSGPPQEWVMVEVIEPSTFDGSGGDTNILSFAGLPLSLDSFGDVATNGSEIVVEAKWGGGTFRGLMLFRWDAATDTLTLLDFGALDGSVSLGNQDGEVRMDFEGAFIAVGLPFYDSVYFYNVSTDSLNQIAAPIRIGTEFGTSVSIRPDATNPRFAVGAPGDGNNGTVTIYDATGMQVKTLPDGATTRTALGLPANGSRFGTSVAFKENTLAIGAPNAPGGGLVSIVRTNAAASSWTPNKQVTRNQVDDGFQFHAATGSNFGEAVDVSNDGQRIAVSARTDTAVAIIRRSAFTYIPTAWIEGDPTVDVSSFATQLRFDNGSVTSEIGIASPNSTVRVSPATTYATGSVLFGQTNATVVQDLCDGIDNDTDTLVDEDSECGALCVGGACPATCTSDADCGGDVCRDDGAGFFCRPTAVTCTGPTVNIDGVCVSECDPSASNPCGADECYIDPTGTSSAGGVCGPSTGICDDPAFFCGPGETCVEGGCFDGCSTQGDCDANAPGTLCNTSAATPYCVPPDANSCDDIWCAAGSTCYDGTCYTDCSSGCASTETCYTNPGEATGRCADTVDPCGDVFCPPDDMGAAQFCHEGACYPSCTSDNDCEPPFICFDTGAGAFCNLPDPCDDVWCPVGDVCYGGSCFEGCTGCGDTCYDGLSGTDRCATSACEGVVCPVGEVCMNGLCGEPCMTSSDCPTSHICEDACATGVADSDCAAGGRCLPDPCQNVNCNTGQTCVDGACVTQCTGPGGCGATEVCYDGGCISDPCDPNPCSSGETCYGGACYTQCASVAECATGQVCSNGRCTESPCTGVDCPVGQVCYEGSCFDPCADDGDCTPPNLCFDGVCAADPCEGISCPVGEVCYGGSCAPPCGTLQDCTTNTDCTGGETCENINPTTNRGHCIDCGAGECWALGCLSDADCATGNYCAKEAASLSGACVPTGCNPLNGSCDIGSLSCRGSACEGVQCPVGQVCYEGSCFDPCASNGDCTPPNLCYDGVCTDDLCRGTNCPVGQVCYAGSCFDPCLDNDDCTMPDFCFNGRCAVDACANVNCPVGDICVGGGCFEGCSVNTDCSEFVGTGDFVEVASSYSLALPEDKEGGFSWADFNGDGCLDVVVSGKGVTKTRVLYSDCNLPDPAFNDITSPYADYLLDNEAARSVVTGDINNDGFPDIVRTGNGRLEAYYNRGPSGVDPSTGSSYSPFSWGVGWPNTPHHSWSGNTEGLGLVDYDGDQDLDIMFQDDDSVKIYRNNDNGTFTLREAGSGLNASLEQDESGDYCAVADFDIDGDVDIHCRFKGTDSDGRDMFRNDGGNYTAVGIMNENSNHKSGSVFCDYDNDGDFDLFWGGRGNNQFWEQPSSGGWIQTGRPLPNSGFDLNQGNRKIEGADCGDVDNDGDMDLLIIHEDQHRLFINQLVETGTVSFANDNRGINTSDGKHGGFVDYDRDGDVDIYINSDSGGNEMWRNPLSGTDYIMIRPRVDLGGGVLRDAIGATITIQDPDGNVLGVRESSGGSGRGGQKPTPVHIGLQNGDNVPYRFIVQFPHNPVQVVERCIIPNTISGYRVLSITNTDADNTTACNDTNWASNIVSAVAGEFCFEDHCAGTACEGITCNSDEICVGGSCVEACTADTDCPNYPADICYFGRCADATNPACDGVKCPSNQACYEGECFRDCASTSDCGGGEICYQGRCAQTNCSKLAGKCPSGTACFQGTCFQNCTVDTDCGVAGESCFDGRCATDSCAAMMVDYQSTHIFTTTGRKLTADQYSRAYIWPRPEVGTGGASFAGYANYAAGSSGNGAVHQTRKARVAFYLDPSLSDGNNPEGQYVLWLTHGSTGAGQGAARASYQIRFKGSDGTINPFYLDNPDEMVRHMTDGNEEIVVTQITSEAGTTGGIAVGPLPARDVNWTVTVDASFSGDIDGWEIYNPELGTVEDLKMGEQLTLRNLAMSPDVVLAEDVGFRCDMPAAALLQGNCTSGTLSCSTGNFGYPRCDQTVFPAAFELCDGEDNNCAGGVDELLGMRVPYVQFNQNDGWKNWASSDSNSEFYNELNFTPRGADDRLGSTDFIGFEGTSMQDTQRSLAFQHRNLQTGELHVGFLHGANAAGGADRDVRMRLSFPGTGAANSESFREASVLYADDGAPAADIAPDNVNVGNFEMELAWQLDENAGTRESDGFALRPNFHQYATGQPSYFDVEFRGQDDDNDDWTDDGLQWIMYQPRVLPSNQNELLKSRELDMRTVARTLNSAFCPSATAFVDATLGTCQLGTYTCSGGVLSCTPPSSYAPCSDCYDGDGDGFNLYDPVLCPTGTDCNDQVFGINPGAAEICNGLDDNCDNLIDIENAPGVCPNGAAECGPAECNFQNICVCPDGPENPLDPPSEPCFCQAQLSPSDEPAEPSSDSQLFEQGSGGCTSAGGTPADSPAALLVLLGLGWAVRDRRKRRLDV